MAPRLPDPRGELSALVLEQLSPTISEIPAQLPALPDDPLADDDLQLALYVA
ncbi:MAG: hypothetical protein QOE86_1276 [Solirubrobacteraceae bacterium]|nr:hypothetical protein [Solirubrobacteraceae bacterium]